MSNMYSECVSVTLVSQQTKRMHLIILSFVACFSLPYFYILSHKRHDLQKKLLQVKCMFCFLYTFVWNIFHHKKNWARCYHKYILVVMPLFLLDFNETWILSSDFRNILRLKVLENSSSGGPVPCRQRDGRRGSHVEASSRFFFFSILRTRTQIRGGNRSAFGWEYFHTTHARERDGWHVKMHLNTGTGYSLDVELVLNGPIVWMAL